MTALSASLVLYHNNPAEYRAAISSFLNGCTGTLYVIDNSASPLQDPLFSHFRVRYFHVGSNIGFGRAHNRAISLVCNKSTFHLVMNPDVTFGNEVIPYLVRFLEKNPRAGVVMPRINNPDGSLQRLCKLLPSPVDLMVRRFIPLTFLRIRINKKYEMHDLPQDLPSKVPSLSGCFLLVRTDILYRLGGFDERFFMYMEDVDLVRRIGDISDTVYVPAISVMHSHAKGSYRNRQLLFLHLQSAVSYFMKWGWFFDKVRKWRNKASPHFF